MIDYNETEKEPAWTLDEALEVVRRLQPLVRPLDFHFAIGGGVVNAGRSYHDLDLYLLPVFKGRPYDFNAIEQLLYDTFGPKSDLIATSEGPTGREGPTYRFQWRYLNNGRTVDVFIGEPEVLR